MKRLMMHAWHGTVASDDHHDELTDSEHDYFENILRKLTLHARNLLHTKWFHHLVTSVILLTAVVVGLQADRYEDEGVEESEKSDSEEEDAILNGIEWGIIIFFAGEILIRFAGEGFHLGEYLRDAWNVFDCFVCIGSLAYRDDGGNGKLVVVLRTLRLLRVLKLVKSLPQLALIVNALIMGLSSIGFIGVILFLAFYMFSIMGIFLFGENDKVHFASLQEAFLTLFRCATLDNWGPVLYVNAFGCDEYPPPYCAPLPTIFDSCSAYEANVTLTATTDSQKSFALYTDLRKMCGEELIFDKCKKPQADFYTSIIFFTIFIVIAAFILLTLFVGVVTTSMEEASKQQNIELAMEEKIQEICQGQEVTIDQLEISRRVFNMLDLDGGGTIDASELRVGLRCVNIFPTDAQLDEYVIEIDQNNDGSIDLIEFVVFMTNMKEKNIKEKLKRDQEEAARRKSQKNSFGMSFRIPAGKYRGDSMDDDDAEVSSQKSNKSPQRKKMLSFFGGAKVDPVDEVAAIETGPPPKSSIYRQLPSHTDEAIKKKASIIQEDESDENNTSVGESDIEEMDI
jgi:Ca2+-binding EF-hand superfamily protein